MMNKFLKSIFLMIGFGLLMNFVAHSQSENDKKWVQLFNGKNLDGWTVKIRGYSLNDNYKNTFRVSEEGTLQVNYDEYDNFNTAFGHIFYNKVFSNYRLRLEYRFTGDQLPDGEGWATRNSGVMLHCQDPATMGMDQNFPVSIEVQLLGGLDNGERSTANLCTPGTHVVIDNKKETRHCIKSNSETYNGDQWVSLEILVRNDEVISHIINGNTVMTYNKPQIGGGNVNYGMDHWKKLEGQPLKKGFISLQSESHPVEFRKIEILELE